MGKIFNLLQQRMLSNVTLYYKHRHLSHQTTEIPPIRSVVRIHIKSSQQTIEKNQETQTKCWHQQKPPNNSKTANKIQAANRRPLPTMKYLSKNTKIFHTSNWPIKKVPVIVLNYIRLYFHQSSEGQQRIICKSWWLFPTLDSDQDLLMWFAQFGRKADPVATIDRLVQIC